MIEQATAKPWTSFWAQRVTGYLAAADGVRLRYSVLLPKGDRPFPVIVKYSGYDSGSIGGSAYLSGDETFSVSQDKFLLDHGYAVMGVSARGTGCSEGGALDFLGREYATDGRDAIQFAANQSWCDGNVGMAGWSWAGMSQLMTAPERPSGLRAIAPGMAVGDIYSDSWAPGGVFAPGFIVHWHYFLLERWQAAENSARDENDAEGLARIAANRAALAKASLPYQVMSRRQRCAYHDERSIRARTHLIDVPVLAMSSWQDEAVLAREGYYHETLDPEKLWVVQTNGIHDLYSSAEFNVILLAFFDRFVKGVANGFEQRPHVDIWMDTVAPGIGAAPARCDLARPSWRISRESFPAQVRPWVLYLGGDRSLAEQPVPGAASDSYEYPVPGPMVNADIETLHGWGEQSPDWKNGSLAYATAPLDRDVVIYGVGSVDLWLSSDMGYDTDVQATLTEVLPSGEEVYVQRGWLRFSQRKLDAARSTDLRPWRLDVPAATEPLFPGQAVLGRIELFPVCHAFRKGSRLRLWLDAPANTGGYGFDIVSWRSLITVHHDDATPSRLALGVLDGVDVPTQRPPPGEAMAQPTRRDPFAP